MTEASVNQRSFKFNQPLNLFDEQWNLGGGNGINAHEAWTIRGDAHGIKVGICDSGIFDAHVELQKNISSEWRNFVEENKKPVDRRCHGTPIAGIIGAQGIHMKGVAPKSELVNFKLKNYEDSDLTNEILIRCIDEAINKKIDILNFSFSSEGNYDSAIQNALTRAAEKVIIIVAAAGNKGQNIDDKLYRVFPAWHKYWQDGSYRIALRNMLIVAASEKATRGLATFKAPKEPASSYGRSSVDIAAPGKEIVATGIYSWWDPWPIFYKGYNTCEGTSMAVPHVVAALALMKAEALHQRPGFFGKKEGELLVQLLLDHGCDYRLELGPYIKGEIEKGGRHLNLKKALEAVRAHWNSLGETQNHHIEEHKEEIGNITPLSDTTTGEEKTEESPKTTASFVNEHDSPSSSSSSCSTETQK